MSLPKMEVLQQTPRVRANPLTLVTYVIEFAAEYDLSNVNAPTDCVGVSRFTVNSCSVDTVTNKITIGATVENDFSVRVGSCSD